LDTLYAGAFAAAVAHFDALARGDAADAAPVVFQASAYLWWAEARDSAGFARERVDSLLAEAIRRASVTGPAADFWLATAHGYRARQHELHGGALAAARDAKAMRNAYRRTLAAEPTWVDCYLGLGLYDYGLARVGFVARLFARILGLGGGDAERGIAQMRLVADSGALARVEAAWVLAAVLRREAARDPERRGPLTEEARRIVERLAERYPANPVFRRFLVEAAAVAPP
ncbi:MAG: hypothetical protein ACREMV_15460, partial [Gemmatimonadales bacterium]